MTIDEIITEKRKAYFSGTILLDQLLREAIQEGRGEVLKSLAAAETARDGYRELSEGQAAVIKDKKSLIAGQDSKIKHLEEALDNQQQENTRISATAKKLKDENVGLKKEITKLRAAKRK